ncbi:MAG: hypothetical protein D6694_04650 [Gammaproteobacteria bacterium]|nr:MAG: hypothetical protein D6694_04650 [Gammaproteobacteria bacterium]
MAEAKCIFSERSCTVGAGHEAEYSANRHSVDRHCAQHDWSGTQFYHAGQGCALG